MNDKMHGNGTVGSGGGDLVERGVSALREKERIIPALPASLVKRTIECVEARSTTAAVAAGLSRGSKREGWWSMKMVRRYSVAAGFTALAGLGIAWGLLGRGATVAFADVVEQVKAAKAVRCTLTATVRESGKQTVFDVLMVEPGWVITSGPGIKMIMSSEKHKMVTLTEAQKQAMVVEVKNPPGAPQFNLLETFKNVDEKKSTALGDREIDGHATKGFEFVKNDMQMKVWADVKSELPVLVEVEQNGLIAADETFSDFDWNPAYDATELTVEVPAGYTAVNASMDMANLSEQDVVTMLKAIGEMNGGVLPADVGMKGVMQVMIKATQGKAPGNIKTMTPEERSAWQQEEVKEAMKLMQPVARGWAFMKDSKNGTEWRYAGSATVGEKGTAVLWYHPAGKESWRVIDADFSVHGEKSAPAGGEAVKLSGGDGAAK